MTFLVRTEGYRRDLRRVEYGDERDAEMREFLLKISPLNNADKIAKPLFVVHGQNDPRVPQQASGTNRGNFTPEEHPGLVLDGERRRTRLLKEEKR